MMNCTQITDRLDEFLDGLLNKEETAQFQQHMQGCADCRAQKEQIIALQEDLKLLPVSRPDPAFFERALKQASKPQRFGLRAGLAQKIVGAALAASVFVWVAANVMPAANQAETQLAGVTMTLHETRTVQISLNAERDLQGARVSIRLPDGVEMKGFPGRRIVSWNADLQQGMNILPLPLVAVALSEGRVIARLEHDSKSKELEVLISVREPGMSRIAVPFYSS
jgi:hypothetical protein